MKGVEGAGGSAGRPPRAPGLSVRAPWKTKWERDRRLQELRRLLIALLLLLTFAFTCLGNSAPAAPVGPHVQPLDSTTVRLAEERIAIHLSRDTRWDPYFSRNAVADFRIWFRFEPQADEQMTVGFPLFVYDHEERIWGGRIENLRVEVDGREVAVAIHEPDRKLDSEADPASWALFPVTFHAGQPLEMVVSYTMAVPPYGKSYGAPFWVAYVLRTGAYWAGTIGRTEAVLTADRPIRAEDIWVEENPFRTTTPGWVLEGGALRWVWEEFEPDFDLHVVMENPYYRDLAREIQAAMDAGVAHGEELVALLVATRGLIESGNMGMAAPLRDGEMPGEAAERLAPAVLAAAEAYLAVHPEDEEVRIQHLLLLRETAVPLRWEEADWVWHVRDEEQFAQFLRQVVAHGMIDAVCVRDWRPWLEEELAGYVWSPGMQDAIAAFLEAVMPQRFDSAHTARAWVEANAGEALARGQVDRLLVEAERRVSSPGSGQQQRPEPDPAAGAAAAAAGSSGPGSAAAGRTARSMAALWLAGASVLLLTLGTVTSRRRRNRGEGPRGLGGLRP